MLLDAAALDARLRSLAEADDLSGTVLLTHRGETVLEGCYGLADRAAGTPITPRTRFGLASVTKLFTAAAVADLVARGLLTFDARVVDVLPADRRPSTLRDDVTVHHLLTHTSGIADYCEEDEDSPNYLEDYGSLWADRPSYSMQRPVDFLPLFGDLAPYRAPGERCQYSNAGYVVLALVVEEVTGRPFTEVVEERVLQRAGMTDSGFFRLDEARPDVAVAYLPATDDGQPRRTNVFSVPVIGGGDGGAYATARDLTRFIRAFDDGSLLGPVHDVVHARHADAGDGYAYGYGVMHAPDGRIGHLGGDPGVGVLVHRWPAEDVDLVVLGNDEDFAWPARRAVLEAWGR